MSEAFIIPSEVILSKIYHLRGVKVMLDRDLAELYDVKSIRLREQVKRNSNRFPENFMFQLTEEEVNLMVSQNAIPSRQHLGGSLPYVFTEHGILQLSNVLKSGRAVEVSIHIINVFVKMREMLITHKDILLELEELRKRSNDQDERIEVIYNYLRQFIQERKNPPQKMGYKK